MIFCFIEGAFIYISSRFWNLLASYQPTASLAASSSVYAW